MVSKELHNSPYGTTSEPSEKAKVGACGLAAPRSLPAEGLWPWRLPLRRAGPPPLGLAVSRSSYRAPDHTGCVAACAPHACSSSRASSLASDAESWRKGHLGPVGHVAERGVFEHRLPLEASAWGLCGPRPLPIRLLMDRDASGSLSFK